VSSIIAVCYDNLPARQVHKGSEVLHKLSEYANRFSEIQALSEVTKES
jgi:protein SPA2